MYTAKLASHIAYRETPNSTGSSKKLRDSQFTLTNENYSNFSFQGNRTLEPVHSSDSEWESESEVVQEASRAQRRVASIRRAAPKKSLDSPYYCQEVGPQLDLGYQWPVQKKSGFVKVTPNNARQRQVEMWQLTKRQSIDRTLLLKNTVYLKDTYHKYDPKFAYDAEKKPKRILTKPSKPVRNEDNDNENFEYILKVNEILGDDPKQQYRVIDLLGQGTFGQVVKCEHTTTGKLFSVKVIKNKTAYKTQSSMEIEILRKLNGTLDPEDKHHILRLLHTFYHKHHLCLVFELLSYNLYDLLGHNRYKGFSPETVRAFAVQILDTLCVLKEAKIIHCDLKPENILLQSEKSLSIKVIDFGSSCHEANRIFTYIQSRFYRSPEVLLGLRYTGAIDMWSFGCIVAELFLGLPLFPGSSEYNQVFRIVEMLGNPPKDMLTKGRNTRTYFNRKQVGEDDYEYELKSREQYNQETSKNELPRKKYFEHTKLDDIVLKYNRGKPSLSREEERSRAAPGSLHFMTEKESRQKEMEARVCLLDFLKGVLELNPLKRWTPQQALQHPFITQKEFTGPFQPDGYIIPMASTSTGLSRLDTNNTLVLKPATRKRSESVGKITAPEQIQLIAQKIHSPITKYPKENVQPQKSESFTTNNKEYRQRNTRSQGDYLGILPPEVKKTEAVTKKVKISPQIKVRRGSHDSEAVVRIDGKSKITNIKKSHVGEAAGGFLMMRRDEGKRTISDAFKRRSIKQ